MNKKIFHKVLGGLIFITALVLMAVNHEEIKNINLELIQKFIKSYGSFAAIVFILIFTLRTLFVVLPVSAMIVIGGSLFGRYSFFYSMLALFLSASLAFYLSRYLGGEWLEKLLKGKVKHLNKKVDEHGFKILFTLRLICIPPYDVLNYAAGLTKVKYRTFISAICLGIVPEAFSLSIFGNSLKHPFSKKFIFAVILVVITVAIPVLYNKFSKKDKELLDGEEEKK